MSVSTFQKRISRAMFRVALPVLHPFLVVSSPFHISLLFPSVFPSTCDSDQLGKETSRVIARKTLVYYLYKLLLPLKCSAGKNHSIKHLLFYLEDTISAKRALITVIDSHIECEEN